MLNNSNFVINILKDHFFFNKKNTRKVMESKGMVEGIIEILKDSGMSLRVL